MDIITKAAITSKFTGLFSTDGQFVIDDNGLISVDGDVTLSGSTTKLQVKFLKVTGRFSCNYGDRLETLEGAPLECRSFSCNNNRLKTLEGAPQSVGMYFTCKSNQLTSLTGGPKSVVGDFYCTNNQLTSLEGLPLSIDGDFLLSWSAIIPLLRLFKVRGITAARIISSDGISPHPVEHIINRYLHLGINGILPCAAELHKAGYSGNAKL